MPNWCDNTLEVYGPEEEVKKLLKICDLPQNSVCDDQVGFFSKFFPRPEGSEEDGRWYDWSIENWGTKWDACGISLSVLSENSIIFEFDTAWSPPEAFVKSIAKKFPRLVLKLSYSEPGCGFSGTLIVCDEDIITDVSHEYVPDVEEAYRVQFDV